MHLKSSKSQLPAASHKVRATDRQKLRSLHWVTTSAGFMGTIKSRLAAQFHVGTRIGEDAFIVPGTSPSTANSRVLGIRTCSPEMFFHFFKHLRISSKDTSGISAHTSTTRGRLREL